MVRRTDDEYKKSVRVNDSECYNPDVYGGGRKKLIRKTVEEQQYKYPFTIIKIKKERQHCDKHPTQKPVALFEYLIKTYTNEGDLVLDNCAGSGTTAIACINTNRNYILIEKEKEYIDIINKRIAEHEQQLTIGVM